jgi:HEAT repeat protein
MTSCPTCGKPVDPLRAPAVRVSAGKVVPYCSKECAEAAETKPVKTAQPAQPAQAATPAKTKTPATGVPKDRDTIDSGPVIEVVHEPKSGVVTSAADARTGRARSNPRAETDSAIQIADTGHVDDYIACDEPKRGKGLLVVVLLLLVLGGAAAAAYYLGYLDQFLQHDQPAAAPKQVELPRPEPVAVDGPTPVTPEAAVESAKQILRAQMKSNSPRVQRVAALALARTGDREALDQLAKALAAETSGNARRDIAYGLARAGDKRGIDALLADVATREREARHDAGRRLALLGDKRAVRALEGSLEYAQFRLGVAEQLAYLAEPRALEVLAEVRADANAVPDEKARATIALGHAGRTDVVPALHELLADDRNNAFAAIALAELHDEAARPVLVKQLAIPSLRVQAARALRRLAPEADVRALLAPLVAELDSNKDTEQVQVAEAILMLAGPPAWSEHE